MTGSNVSTAAQRHCPRLTTMIVREPAGMRSDPGNRSVCHLPNPLSVALTSSLDGHEGSPVGGAKGNRANIAIWNALLRHNASVVNRRQLLISTALGAAAGVGAAMLVQTSNHPTTNNLSSVDADDLDKEQLEQLHAATLKASDSCFELKKLCATVLIPTATLVTVLNGKSLDASVFIAGLLVILTFWLADSVGYYYQRKLRAAMNPIWTRRAQRCTEPWPFGETTSVGPIRAAFNSSMYFYLLLAGLIFVGLALLTFDVIGSVDVVQR
jgi:hypothetical protein